MRIYFRLLVLACFLALPGIASAQARQQSSVVSEVKHFPNPTSGNNVISISFNLASASYVNIRIFNPLGILVKELANGNFAPGEHSMPLDISSYNEGVYFYTVRVNEYSETKKLTIKK